MDVCANYSTSGRNMQCIIDTMRTLFALSFARKAVKSGFHFFLFCVIIAGGIDMNKEFEAYYTHEWNGIWFFLIAILCVCTIFSLAIGFVFNTLGIWLLVFALLAALSAGVIFAAKQYRYHSQQSGIAIEVANNTLILHKATTVVIPLSEIRKIGIHDEAGSFDLILYTHTGKESMHCFVADQPVKRQAFIDLIRSKNITIYTFTLTE